LSITVGKGRVVGAHRNTYKQGVVFNP
jgi:hypothetical protein